MHKWADKIKAIQDERIGLAIVAANNHYAGFGPGSSPCYKTREQRYSIKSMSQNVSGLRLEDLEIKPHLITKLKDAGIESIFDLAISIPHQLIEDGSILTGCT